MVEHRDSDSEKGHPLNDLIMLYEYSADDPIKNDLVGDYKHSYDDDLTRIFKYGIWDVWKNPDKDLTKATKEFRKDLWKDIEEFDKKFKRLKEVRD